MTRFPVALFLFFAVRVQAQDAGSQAMQMADQANQQAQMAAQQAQQTQAPSAFPITISCLFCRHVTARNR
jgi:hypothetical protein